MLLLLLKLISLISITTILVLGYTIVTQPGMALYKIREWAENKKEEGSKWVEPILICNWCQPSTFSLISFAFALGLGIINHFEWNLILYYILTVGGSSIANGIIWEWHLKQDAEKEFYKSCENAADAITDSIYAEHEEEYEEEFNHQHN